MRVITVLTLALALGAAAPAARPALGAQVRGERGERGSRIDTSLTFAGRGTVDLSLLAGEIVVTGWSRGDVRVRAYSEYGQLRLDVSPSRIELGQRAPARRGDTRYELSVPTGTRVLARSHSGDLTVRGTQGEVEAQTTSGAVDVREAGERVGVGSISGDIRLERITGAVRAETMSGEITAEAVTGDVDLETVSGHIGMREMRSKWVRAEAVSGTVAYGGRYDPAGRYELSSHSGDVRIALPADVGARVTVEMFSGELDSAFPITLQPSERATRSGARPRQLEFLVGSGGAQISAQTFSGSVYFTRALESPGERRDEPRDEPRDERRDERR